MKKILTLMTLIIAVLIILSSCNILKDASEKDTLTDNSNGLLYGSYSYPDNPVEELREYLKNDAKNRGLPFEVGVAEQVAGAWEDKIEFMILFSSDNACAVSFATKKDSTGESYYSLDGKDNPSFTLLFRDSDNFQDMRTVLTSVIKYLSPELSLEEADGIAINQDVTISTDGYAMPQDIGGYQVQAHYTNPHIFAKSSGFDSMLGVRITALKQVWGELDTGECQKLEYQSDYRVLSSEYAPWEDDYQTNVVYADFVVKNVWQHEDWVHGDTWETVDVESMTGEQYTLRVETMRMSMNYEFGVGQQYTLYIYTGTYYGAEIIHAIQRSSSTHYNSRGESQPLDYPNQVWEDRVVRVEPEEDGTVYDIYFELRCPYGEVFAAVEGRGVGEEQWPGIPSREGYEFAGWYDNVKWDGEPYTMDTPINQETTLYAKWNYTGSGGYWPRPHRGVIQGIEEGGSFNMNQTISITAEGYNVNLVTPQDQRFRWIPLRWKVSDSISGDFLAEAPYSAEFSIVEQGAYTLYITYSEEIFDGLNWQKTGQIRDVEEVMFQVKK